MLSDLVFGLKLEETEVEVISSRKLYDSPKAELPAVEDIFGVRVHRVWTTRFGRAHLIGRTFDYLSFYVAASLKLLFLIGRNDIVVVKTDPPLMSVPVLLISKFRRAKQVNWLQDLFPEIAQVLDFKWLNSPLGTTLKWFRNLSLKHSSSNVVLGELMHSELIANNVLPNLIEIIPNWADGHLISPVSKEDNPLRSEWGFRDEFVVGYAGNLGRAHMIEAMLSAAVSLKEHRNIVFLFIGGGVLSARLQRSAEEIGLENMRFEPYQKKASLTNALGAADVHMVSLNEVLEGLIVPSKFYGVIAAGRPTLYLGDSNGEIARVLSQHQIGHTISNSDPEGLAAQILVLAQHQDDCIAMGLKARQVFAENYSKELSLKKWQSLLTRIQTNPD